MISTNEFPNSYVLASAPHTHTHITECYICNCGSASEWRTNRAVSIGMEYSLEYSWIIPSDLMEYSHISGATPIISKPGTVGLVWWVVDTDCPSAMSTADGIIEWALFALFAYWICYSVIHNMTEVHKGINAVVHFGQWFLFQPSIWTILGSKLSVCS